MVLRNFIFLHVVMIFPKISGNCFKFLKILFFYSTLVAARSVHDSGDHQIRAARRAVSTWMGDRLDNIDS